VQKRILIADDDVSYREAFTRIAEKEGYKVIAVGNGADMLTVVNETDVDVVVADLKMPYLSGESAVEIMHLKGDKTPIIGITGLTNYNVGQISDRFLRVYYKPIDMTELFVYIKSLF
jgi:DNA-binding NtrC family response regulator